MVNTLLARLKAPGLKADVARTYVQALGQIRWAEFATMHCLALSGGGLAGWATGNVSQTVTMLLACEVW